MKNCGGPPPFNSNRPRLDEDVCAMLTPTGRGAVAVIWFQGASATKTIDKLFVTKSGDSVSGRPNQRLLYGHWKPTAEDVILIRKSSQAFEIHCHGGKAAPATIMGSLKKHGFRALQPIELATAIHQSGWKAQIANAISQATTERSALLLLHQYSIADKLVKRFTDLLQTHQKETLLLELPQVIQGANFGIHLTRPWSVVVCGKPNVGKSSLMNAIVGFNRAIVHAQPGTTRDVVTQTTAVDGWPIELKDTAGLRNAEDSIEAIGVRLSREEIRSADLVVAVFDATGDWTREDHELLDESGASLAIFNKQDALEADFEPPNLAAICLQTSAKTGAGIPLLVESLAAEIASELPARDLLLPINAEQEECVRQVLELVRADQFVPAIELWQSYAQ